MDWDAFVPACLTARREPDPEIDENPEEFEDEEGDDDEWDDSDEEAEED